MKSNRKWLAWMVPTALSLAVGVGCAHQQPTQQATAEMTQVDKLRLRLEEVEQTNGRLNVRIEELEDQLFLLQDMTESNRIALQRNGYMQRGTYLSRRDPQARAPGPTPESYSGEPNPYSAPYNGEYQPPQERRAPSHITRIPLADSQKAAQARPEAPVEPEAGASDEQEPMDEIVITDAEFRAFAGEPPPSTRRAKSSQPGTRRAQKPVTEEKLATTEHLKGAKGAGAQKPAKAEAAASGNPLSLYKTALAEYRKGNYAQALTGFHAFLSAKPNPNYIDNGLYWIGECHYGLGDYQEANVYFTRVLREQPDGNKVPDAMLKMSLAHERMGQLARTREWLEKLTDQFPTSNAGRLGAQKLATLPEKPARN